MDLSERGSATGRHPWEIERFRAYRRILADHGALAARRVLDVGAGDGWFSESLLADSPNAEQIVCWDINYNELELATDDPRLVRTAVAPTPGFDLVLVLDVLEHIDDPQRLHRDTNCAHSPRRARRCWSRVPAHPGLFGDHDRALGHYRRYRPEQLLDRGRAVDRRRRPRAAVPEPGRRRARRRSRVERLRPSRGIRSGDADDPRRRRVAPRAGRRRASVCRLLAADAGATRRLGRVGRRLTGLSHWVFGLTR